MVVAMTTGRIAMTRNLMIESLVFWGAKLTRATSKPGDFRVGGRQSLSYISERHLD